MGNLTDHAERELELAGLDSDAAVYDGMIGDAVLEIVEVFSKQGHSGASAAITLDILKKVLAFEPITPLTGEESEWNEVREGVYQNKRCSRVFKEKGRAYDINGKIFEEPSGSRYTCVDSRVLVLFPYVPHSEIVKVPAERKP